MDRVFVREIAAPALIAASAWAAMGRTAGAQSSSQPARESSAGHAAIAAVAASAADAAAPSDAAPIEGGGVKQLVRDVASDYKNFVSVENAKWLAAGGIAALGVHAGDRSIASAAVDESLTLPGGATYGSQYLHIPVAFAWWGVASLAGSSRHADTGRDLVRVQLSVVSWTYAIKLATDRTRPNGDPHSFPSGHASTSFATATVLQEHYGWKIGLPAFAAAGYTAVSRVAANQHWTSDVVFGAVIGMVSGRTVTLRLRESRVTVAPLAAPAGGGIVATVTR
jgi:membrane-associated phospholipid phosphatase